VSATQTSAVPVNYLQEWQPLLEDASREVFEIMLGTKVDVSKPAKSSTDEITAMVGLAGVLCGLVTLGCGNQSGASMASRMLGTQIQPGDNQMFDAVGEITNMVAGNFKNKLTDISFKCMLSVPTVVIGSNYRCRSMADAPPLQVTVIFEGAPISIK